MKRIKYLAIGFFLCVFFWPKMSDAQATSEKTDLPWEVYVPCANGGFGEWIKGTLTLHYVVNKVKWYHHQPMGGVLVGEETGTVYRITGITEHISIENPKDLSTYVDIYHFTGGGIQFMERIVYHVNIKDGQPTVIVDQQETYCR